VKVQEGGSPTPMPLYAAARDASGSVPIEAGTQQVQASVTVTYGTS
jgi:uncharacterized protein YggE